MSDTEDPDIAAGRLEAALERIAHVAGRAALAGPPAETVAHSEEIAARLDNLIDRLRAVLGGKSD